MKKNILITGSSSGLGFELAKMFNENKENVILNGRDKEALKKATAMLSIKGFQNDVSIDCECNQLIKKVITQCGKLDAVICNVGSGRSVKRGQEDINEWRRIIDLNFFSSINIIQAVLNQNLKDEIPIVFISSICGSVSVDEAPITYSVAKSALNTYIKFNSKFLLSKGIRLNGVMPGNLNFKGSVWNLKQQEDPGYVSEVISKTPCGRLGTPKDIYEAIDFLISPKSNYVVGEIIAVDGGFSL